MMNSVPRSWIFLAFSTFLLRHLAVVDEVLEALQVLKELLRVGHHLLGALPTRILALREIPRDSKTGNSNNDKDDSEY